ncbi:auxin response factor 17-like [Amaranthus tricolor]|uniref:auxin response factor 17-like n=1 Tax=Amaranthus tricolor TaxID=29722 RepID=UPI00258A8B4E|nr:auxin response factor 17-like [Amaranthus tricolor]
MASSINQRVIDPEIWQACAGILIEIPKVDYLVYYFPQGHIEHASSIVTVHLLQFVLKMSNSGSNLIKIDQKSIENVLSFSNVFKPPYTSMMFTTNWPEFVRIKKLKAGDTIVLKLKESTNEHFIGIRRDVNWSTKAGRNSANEVEIAIEKEANKESL